MNCDIGIYGLGIMGQNLSLNFADKGYRVTVYNRTEAGEEEVTDNFIKSRCLGKNIFGAGDVIKFVNSIRLPRKILMMVKSGEPVDDILEQLIILLDPGDIVIDGGNSHYLDTTRRLVRMETLGFLFIGCGISGGGEGALLGPSIMLGGSIQAWEPVRLMFQAISAKTEEGTSSCNWVGPEGSGHLVKMVHNGIEYALMQMLAESYDVMKRMLEMSTKEIHDILAEWCDGELQSYLLRITLAILDTQDENGYPLIDKVLDCAMHKNSGKNTSIASIEMGIPATTITEAVNARYLSMLLDERHLVSKEYICRKQYNGDRQTILTALHDALCCSNLIAYIQGFSLITKSSEVNGWNIVLPLVANIWRNGSIIQSDVLNTIAEILDKTIEEHLVLDCNIKEKIEQYQRGWRDAIMAAVDCGIPVPTMSAALGYFDGLRSEQLPTNLIQAQRDYFGVHGFELRVQPRGDILHSSWGRNPG